MAMALATQTYCPPKVFTRKNHVKEFEKKPTTVKISPSTVKVSPIRMIVTPLKIKEFKEFSGLHALDFAFRKPKVDFHSKMASEIYFRRGKPTRVVAKAMFDKFTDKSLKVIMLSQDESRRLGHKEVCTGEILLGLVSESTGIAAKVLKSVGITLKEARTALEKILGRGSGLIGVDITFSPSAKNVLYFCAEQASALGHTYIATEHLLLALIREGKGVAAQVIESFKVGLNEIRQKVIQMVGKTNETVGDGVAGETGDTKMPTFLEYGTDLTKLAREGKLDPVIGRKEPTKRAIEILGRRSKNNPCLIGEPGVGKTAIIEGIAQLIVTNEVPETLKGKTVISLDTARLVAGTKFRGEFEERVKNLLEEIKQSKDIILFIDEVHTLIGAGAAEGAIDAANILKPALARGELQCIGATTLEEYRKHIEKDPALERRFQPVQVPEPTVEETIEILRGLKELYEIHHKVHFTVKALESAAKLSHKYIRDRFLPDKAIDLIDEAGSRVNLRRVQIPEEARVLEEDRKKVINEKNEAIHSEDFEKAVRLRDREKDLQTQITMIKAKGKEMGNANALLGEGWPTVTEEDISQIVASRTGIPVSKVSGDESKRLLNLEATLHKRVIGQHEAVEAISRAIRRSRVGLKSPKRPIASFFFSGPTGVGKSELAKALAGSYHDSEEAMIRLDMSEYMERHTVAKLIGSPPGYVGYDEGGQLTEAVRRRPYSVVLFDEIEKAHPDVFNLMLQILEDGRLTDSKGRTVDFRNTILIMTSNVGSSLIEKEGQKIGFEIDYDEKESSSYDRIKSLVNEELKLFFKPEFLNRLDEIIVFRQLTKIEVGQIAVFMIKEVVERLRVKDIELQVTPKFTDKIVQEGYDPSYGARPLRRAITRLLEDSLADKMLEGNIKEGDTVIIDVNAGKVVVLVNGIGSEESDL